MTQREVITEEMIQAAISVLEGRIALPPPPAGKKYSRREAFVKLRGKAREALAAGHSLETVLDDLKGIGLGMTISTARQYLKPGRKTNRNRGGTRSDIQEKTPTTKVVTEAVNISTAKKGTFAVIDDEQEI